MAETDAAAWSSEDPEAVVSFYREDGSITINRSDPVKGRAALLEMVSGFYSAFPGLSVSLVHLRVAGDHVMFGWVLDGKYAKVCSETSAAILVRNDQRSVLSRIDYR